MVAMARGHHGRRRRARAALWHRVLEARTLSDLRALAAELASPMVEDAVLDRGADLKPTAARWRGTRWRCDSRRVSGKTHGARFQSGDRGAPKSLFSDAAQGQRIAPERLDAANFDEATHRMGSGWGRFETSQKMRRGASLPSHDDEAVAEVVEIVRPLAQLVKKELARAGAVSFDGLLVRARNVVRDFPDVRAALKKRFDAFLVDEFQDTDPLQGEILFYLAEETGSAAKEWRHVVLGPGRLFVVGDPKQSIYRFRGADIRRVRSVFQEAMRKQGALSVALSANFRSEAPILDFANGLFPRRDDRNAVSPARVRVLGFRSNSDS